MTRISRFPAAFAAVLLASQPAALAQNYTPMKEIPGNELMRRMQSAMGGIGDGGNIGDAKWDVAASQLWFNQDGWKTLDLKSGAIAPATGEPPANLDASRTQRGERGRRGGPARGRQFASADSPDGAWTAVSEKGNLFLAPKSEQKGADRIAVTTDGTDDIKYGQASWVYGEELDQTTAMWWSPDSRFIAFYRFDESKVKDFFLIGGWTDVNTRVMSEAYPKPGAPNPTAHIMVYEVASKKTVEIDAFSDASGAKPDTEYYLYNVRWTPDGSELLVSRTPRRQDVLDVLAANPATGNTRIVVTEKQDAWQDNAPGMHFLKDGKRFIWESEKSGYKHYELRNIDGSLINPITKGEWPVDKIFQIDEEAGELWFTAWSGKVAVQQQLHVAKLDGSSCARVTGGDFHHNGFRLSPDGAYLVATAETVSTPAKTVVYARDGKLVATLAEGSAKGFKTHNLTPSELFTCKAADGKTDLYGRIAFPPAFDPSKKYPVVVNTYGGPTVRLVTDKFSAGDSHTALGFITVTVDNRGTPNRGKAFETAAYLKLGQVDVDDQAAAVTHLAKTRPYVDGARVGITGSSYGGYMSAAAVILRGDAFKSAVAVSAPTDWRNYDSIYTERYMRTPQENPEGYDAGSCVKHAGKLTGNLLLLHGMVDDNVHPNNAFQLINALQSINKPFSMMFFPNSDHGVGGPAAESVTWSYFVNTLAPVVPEWGAKNATKPEAAAKAETGTSAKSNGKTREKQGAGK